MKKIIYFVIILFSFTALKAQNQIDTICNKILQNNKQVSSYSQYIESVKLSSKTGILPKNPTVEFNYLLGNPTEIGNQTEFALIQTFDFPTLYFQNGNLSDLQIKQADLELKLYEKTVLTQIKLAYIEQVYLNRRKQELQKRFDDATILFNSFQEKFEKGEINQIEINKSLMQLITTKNQLLTIENQITVNNKKLEWLNGNSSILITDSIYPLFAEYQNIDTLYNQLKSNNISLQIAEIETQISEKEISVAKSNSLPKFEIGYMQESIGNQKLKGIHTGISIPLWENKNTVKSQKVEFLYQQQEFENLQSQKQIELQQKFLTLQQLNKMIIDSKKLIDNNINPILLKQQLDSGLISIIEYYTELSNYYIFIDSYEEMQKEYYKIAVELQNEIN